MFKEYESFKLCTEKKYFYCKRFLRCAKKSFKLRANKNLQTFSGEVKPVDRKWTSVYGITPEFCFCEYVNTVVMFGLRSSQRERKTRTVKSQ